MTLVKCFLLIFVLYVAEVRSTCFFNGCECEDGQDICDGFTEFPMRYKIEHDNVKHFLSNFEITDSDIARIPAGRMKNLDIEMARFRGNGISDIDPHAFDGADIYQLSLMNNKIYQIDERTFMPLANTLEILDLGYNVLHLMSDDLYKPLIGLKRLSTLTLSGNKLKRIPNLSIMTQCKDLQLNDNEIYELLDYSTNELLFPPDLITLNLEHNKIMKLDPNAFKSLQDLKFFNLDDNLIESIDADTFKYLPNLHTLSIKKNMIAHIPANVFRLQPLISKVDFSAQNRMLKSISDYAFSRPTSSNVFDTLDLSNNQLETLPDKAFCNQDARNPFQKFKSVYLAANLMRNLNPCIMRQLVHGSGMKTKVDFNHNPAIHVDRNQYDILTCNCNVTMAAEAVDLVGKCQKYNGYIELMIYKCDTEASTLDEYCSQFPQFNCDPKAIEKPKFTKLTHDLEDEFKKTNRPSVNNVVNTHTSSNNEQKNRQNQITKKPSQISTNSTPTLSSRLTTSLILVATLAAIGTRY